MSLELREAGVKLDGRWLARGASLAPRAGGVTALVGPNGSGKTTLLRLLGGLWRPTAGRALLDGTDLHLFGRRELARRVAFTPQDTNLTFPFDVRDVVSMGRHPHIRRFEREKKEDQTAVVDAMERADVAHLAGRPVTELSGGERQRALIARSLATEADTMLLDEPTANLDVAHALAVLDLCRELAGGGKTVVLTVHDLNLARRYASHLVLIAGGRVVAAGAPDEVLTDAAILEVFGVRTERAAGRAGGTALLFHRAQDSTKVRKGISTS